MKKSILLLAFALCAFINSNAQFALSFNNGNLSITDSRNKQNVVLNGVQAFQYDSTTNPKTFTFVSGSKSQAILYTTITSCTINGSSQTITPALTLATAIQNYIFTTTTSGGGGGGGGASEATANIPSAGGTTTATVIAGMDDADNKVVLHTDEFGNIYTLDVTGSLTDQAVSNGTTDGGGGAISSSSQGVVIRGFNGSNSAPLIKTNSSGNIINVPLVDMNRGTAGASTQRVSIATDDQVNVSLANPLPAGTNTIGKVDILTQLPSGGNVLGLIKLTSTTGNEVAAIKAASTAPVATDQALVVSMSPNSPQPNSTIGTSAFHRVTDGTNTVAVKAPSVAATTTDPALVVAVSPNGVLKVGDGTSVVAVATGSTPPNNGANAMNVVHSPITTFLKSAIVTGAATATLNNNILNATAGVGSLDLLTPANFLPSSNGNTYKSFTCEIVLTGTVSAGAVTFEVSNDNVNFTPIQVIDDNVTSSCYYSNLQLSTGVHRFVRGACNYRYLRARLSTAITGGGTATAYTTFSADNFIEKQTINDVSVSMFSTQGTITTGGTAQWMLTVPTANNRRGWMATNNSAGNLFLNFGGAASATACTKVLAPNETFTCPPNLGHLSVSIFGATTGQAFSYITY